MLKLPSRTTNGLLVMEDDADTERVFVASAVPRIVRRADGGARISLLHWIAPAADGPSQSTGGRLTVDLTTEPTDEQLSDADLGGRRPAPLPWVDATVELEGPGLPPLATDVALAARSTGVIAADLTGTQASILAPLLSGTVVSPLQVVWAGHVRARLPPVEVFASADVAEIEHRRHTVDGAYESIVTRSILSAVARVEIRGASNAELEQALREWVLDELAQRVARGEPLLVHASAAEVVRWPLRIAGTLDAIAPLPARSRAVEEVVLDRDDVGAIPPLEVRVLGDFGAGLERVDLELQRDGAEAVALALTDDAPHRVAFGSPDFRWRHRARIVGVLASWSAWKQEAHRFSLLVPVPSPPELVIEVLAIAIDWESRWSRIRVDLIHTSPGGATLQKGIELDASQPRGVWTAPLSGPRGSLQATLTFTSLQGYVETRNIEAVGDQLLVTDPYAARLERALVPTGSGWEDVALAMIDLRYEDGERIVEESLGLREVTDFARWEVPARPGGPQSVRWRLNASFTDGRFLRTGWVETDGPVLTIPLLGRATRELHLLPIHFDASALEGIEVALRSGSVDTTISLRDRQAKVVRLPPGSFSCSITWIRRDGSRSSQPPRDLDDDVLVIPRAPT